MIALNSVSKSFGDKPVLQSIHLNFEQGSTHILLGASGCGKSTLLRMIIGLIHPTEGEVIVDGSKVTPQSQRGLAQKIGYVIQDGGLFPHLSGFENVALVADTLGWPKEKQRKRVDELGELVSLHRTVLQRYPKELSGGQKQRLALMRALMLNPDILLLDEPLGALDPVIRAGLQQELRSIFSRLKKTVVLVTHDIGEAAYFGDTITLFESGRVLQHGAFADLIKKPASSQVTEFIQAQRPVPLLKELL